MLTQDKEVFHQEKAEILQVGLVVSSYIGVDDTGARHQGQNGYCTVVGNDWFTYFESTASKSRLNFLQVLQGGQRDYVVNQAARNYWEKYEIAAAIVAKLTQGPQQFTEETTWQAHLQELGITGARHVRVVTEGALLGGLVSRGVSPDLHVLSDGAGQFVIFAHCSCWIHMERPLPRLVPHNEEHRAAIEGARQRIWEFYQELKTYKKQPDAARSLFCKSALMLCPSRGRLTRASTRSSKTCPNTRPTCCACWTGRRCRCITMAKSRISEST